MIFLLATLNRAEASFPENNLHLLDDPYSQSVKMTEEEFNTIIDSVINVYRPIVEARGKRLMVEYKWLDSTVNAYANQTGDEWRVSMFGGLARRPEVTDDGFALVVCHELGHHLAGFPFYAGRPMASEGQSDYFASQNCARKVWGPQKEINATFRDTADPQAKAVCDQQWATTDDQNLCYRIVMAGHSLATLLGTLGSREVSFGAKDNTEVASTLTSHPNAQCRLDTYTAGALCERSTPDDQIPGLNAEEKVAEELASQVSCTSSDFYPTGYRPRCWFKPTRQNMIFPRDLHWEEIFGNGNGVPEPGEAFEVSTVLRNRTEEDFSEIYLNLAPKDKLVKPIRAKAMHHDLFANSSSRQDQPFIVYFDRGLECGGTYNLDMNISMDKRKGVESLFKQIGVIEKSNPFLLNSDTVVPDFNPTGILSVQWIQNIEPAKFANVKVRLVHSYPTDVKLKLISSNGRSYPLVSKAPRVRGEQELNFKVQVDLTSVSGLWALHAVDTVRTDEGKILSWSLEFEKASCETPTMAWAGLADYGITDSLK